MKRILALLLAVCMILALGACASQGNEPSAPSQDAQPSTDNTPSSESQNTEPEENLTAVQKIIKEAEGMTLEELAKKAIEESNGKMFYGVGNSSRGKSALPL